MMTSGNQVSCLKLVRMEKVPKTTFQFDDKEKTSEEGEDCLDDTEVRTGNS
jgi:hypothetical protein